MLRAQASNGLGFNNSSSIVHSKQENIIAEKSHSLAYSKIELSQEDWIIANGILSDIQADEAKSKQGRIQSELKKSGMQASEGNKSNYSNSNKSSQSSCMHMLEGHYDYLNPPFKVYEELKAKQKAERQQLQRCNSSQRRENLADRDLDLGSIRGTKNSQKCTSVTMEIHIIYQRGRRSPSQIETTDRTQMAVNSQSQVATTAGNQSIKMEPQIQQMLIEQGNYRRFTGTPDRDCITQESIVKVKIQTEKISASEPKTNK